MISRKEELEYKKEILLVQYRYEKNLEKKKTLKRIIESIDAALNAMSMRYTFLK